MGGLDKIGEGFWTELGSPARFEQPTLWVENLTLNDKGKRIWRMVPTVGCWSMCLEHNNWVFSNYVGPSFKTYKRTKENTIFWASMCKGWEELVNGFLQRGWNQVIGIALGFEGFHVQGGLVFCIDGGCLIPFSALHFSLYTNSFFSWWYNSLVRVQ